MVVFSPASVQLAKKTTCC